MNILPIETDDTFFKVISSIMPKVIYQQNSLKKDMGGYNYFYFPDGGVLIARCTTQDIKKHHKFPKGIKLISNWSEDINKFDEDGNQHLD
jgi:hypothetical protein